jgi:trehalose 6-phosphate synthase
MWTRERMVGYLRRRLGGRRLIVVANREPYVHEWTPDGIRFAGPEGGLVSALDPILQGAGGTWIAHGSGSGDRETADVLGRINVPPGTEAYTLRRVWLTGQEEDDFYYRCCHEGIWPLCHTAYHRPQFSEDAWEAYGRVNRKFAQAVVEEAGNDPCVVLIQNYHFALLPQLLRPLLPSAILCHFWHIPWPAVDVLGTFPWRKDLLDGLLGSDVILFHLEEHRAGFLEAVRRETEAKVDSETSEVRGPGKMTRVRSAPISVDSEALSREALSKETSRKVDEWRSRLLLGSRKVLLSVGRFDYTEGFPERVRAFRRLLEIHPEYHDKVVLVEIAIPPRGALPTYTRFRSEAVALVEDVNRAFGTAQWQPVIVVCEDQSRSALTALYRLADVCLVTSLHDGMSLVAKEYLSARPDGQGALVLSNRSGAARELHEAILTDPFDVCEMAGAIRYALEMPADERERIFRKLRSVVQSRNVFRWAGKLFKEALSADRPTVKRLVEDGAPRLCKVRGGCP